MDEPKGFTRRILEYIKRPFTRQLNLQDEDMFHSPNNTLEDIKSSFLGSNESILVEKTEYENLIEKVEILEKEKSINKAKSEEYKSLLIDFDTTLTFMMEKDSSFTLDDDKGRKVEELNKRIIQLEKSEERLQSIITSLRNDLIKSEEKVEAYRQIAGEKIESLVRENERLQMLYEIEKEAARELRNRNADLGTNVENVERLLQNICLDDSVTKSSRKN